MFVGMFQNETHNPDLTIRWGIEPKLSGLILLAEFILMCKVPFTLAWESSATSLGSIHIAFGAARFHEAGLR